MAQSRAAQRYAHALLGIAVEQKQFESVSADMAMLGNAISSSRDLLNFLRSPVVNKAKKRAVVTELLKGKVGEITFRFIELITAKERESILPEIIESFSELRDRHLGILRATVRTASPMSAPQKDSLQKHLSSVTGKNIMLDEKEDKSLLGGFALQYDDTVWDGSVKHQLAMLRERFEQSAG